MAKKSVKTTRKKKKNYFFSEGTQSLNIVPLIAGNEFYKAWAVKSNIRNFEGIYKGAFGWFAFVWCCRHRCSED